MGIDNSKLRWHDLANTKPRLASAKYSHTKGTDSTMKVAIVGAGNVGKALGSSLTRAGHEVIITASNPEHAQIGRAHV